MAYSAGKATVGGVVAGQMNNGVTVCQLVNGGEFKRL